MEPIIDRASYRTISQADLSTALAPYGLEVLSLDPTPTDDFYPRFVRLRYDGLTFESSVSSFVTSEVGYALKRLGEVISFARTLPSQCSHGQMFYDNFDRLVGSAYGKERKGANDAYSLAADMARSVGVRLHS